MMSPDQGNCALFKSPVNQNNMPCKVLSALNKSIKLISAENPPDIAIPVNNKACVCQRCFLASSKTSIIAVKLPSQAPPINQYPVRPNDINMRVKRAAP